MNKLFSTKTSKLFPSEIKNNCPICAGSRLKIVFELNSYKIQQCQKCRYARLLNRPSTLKFDKFYQTNYFNDKKTNDYLSDGKYKFKKLSSLLGKNKKILDYGCGTGDFIAAAKNKHQMVGYDISREAAKLVHKKYGIKVLTGKLSKNFLKKSSLDAVVMFDVIEHLTDLDMTFQSISYWLKKNGLLIITTPNIESWDAKLLGKKWYGYTKIPQHIHYFSPSAVKILTLKHNFCVKSVKQWGFVRSLNFIINNSSPEDSNLAKILKFILGLFRLNHRRFFFPLVDMMIIAIKK